MNCTENVSLIQPLTYSGYIKLTYGRQKKHNSCMAVPKELKQYFRKLGAKGGKAKAANMTDAERKQLGKQLAEARAKARNKRK